MRDRPTRAGRDTPLCVGRLDIIAFDLLITHHTEHPTSSSIMLRAILTLLLLLTSTTVVVNASPSSSGVAPPTSGSTTAIPLRFASPIQSYTIFDRSALSSIDAVIPRRRFLPRFRVGLLAECTSREALMEEQRRGIAIVDDEDDINDGSGWAEASAAADERRRKATEARIEAAHDAAVKAYDDKLATTTRNRIIVDPLINDIKFQFVGVANDGKSNRDNRERGDNVTWYARKRPTGSKWNVRLVHVNRDAVLRDLFVKGKVDVFGKYISEGAKENAAFTAADASGEDNVAGVNGGLNAGGGEGVTKPYVKAMYAIKERSWRTLWNFSPRRMFTTSSGSFWRERRILPGLYTDGITVYESVYRYRDGRNGMKPVAKLNKLLSSPGIRMEEKARIMERLKGGDVPDLVMEK